MALEPPLVEPVKHAENIMSEALKIKLEENGFITSVNSTPVAETTVDIFGMKRAPQFSLDLGKFWNSDQKLKQCLIRVKND